MKWSLGALLALVLAGGLGAQEVLVLTSDQAVALAVKNNLGLRSEEWKLEAKRRERDFSWNKFLPSVTASATVSRLNTETTVSGFVPFPSAASGSIGAPVTLPGVGTVYDGVLGFTQEVNPTNLSTSLSVQLPLTLAQFKSAWQTVLDYQSAVLSREAAQAKLERDIRKAFYGLLAQQEALILAEKQMESVRQRYLQTQASFRSGLVPELTLLQSQVAWENRKPALEDQRLGYRQTLLGLKNLLGVPLDQEIKLEGSISLPNVDLGADEAVLIRDYLRRRLDLQVLEAQAAALEHQVGVVESSVWPSLVLMASWDPGLNNPLEPKQWENSDNWKQRSGMLGLTLSWKLDSLIPGSSTWVQVENLKASAAQLDLSRQQALNGAAIEVKTLLAKLKKSATSLQTLNLSVSLASRAAQLSEIAYRAGTQSLLEVQEAELQLQAAQLQVLNEKLNINNNLLDLEGALGTPWTEIFKEKTE